MEKTESINLGGRVFVLDEDAYSLLSGYLSKVRTHIGSDVDCDEVMGDIEISMSEKLRGKLTDQKQVIGKADVEQLISVMGTVEDFERNFGGEEKGPEMKEAAEKDDAPIRKLYRDPDNRIIAGVCSGIAAYFRLDPFIVRALFVLLFLAGVGITLPLYLALWIITPSAQTMAQKLEMEGSPQTIASISQSRRAKIETIRSSRRDKADTLLPRLATLLVYLFGLFLIIGSLATILGVTTGAGVAWKYAHDYAYISDVPVSEILAAFPLGLFTVLSVLAFAIPAFLVLVAGLAMTFRKRMVNSTLLVVTIAFWLLCGFADAYIVMSDAGRLQTVFAESERVQRKSESFVLEDFNTVSVKGAKLKTVIRQGNDRTLTVEGRKIDLDSFSYKIENGNLLLNVDKREIGADCFSCNQRTVLATLVVPDVKNVKAEKGELELDGSYGTLGIEAAEADVRVGGEEKVLSVKARGGHIRLGQKAQELSLALDGAQLEHQGEAAKVSLQANGEAEALLSGKADSLTAALQQGAVLSSLDLAADTVQLDLKGKSWAAVDGAKEVSGKAEDESGICYLGNPKTEKLAAGPSVLLKRVARISSYDYAHREEADSGKKYFYDGRNHYEIIKESEESYGREAEAIQEAFRKL
jgi:phage shock protein PspC (stress-responsive transcriptional regulator)